MSTWKKNRNSVLNKSRGGRFSYNRTPDYESGVISEPFIGLQGHFLWLASTRKDKCRKVARGDGTSAGVTNLHAQAWRRLLTIFRTPASA